MLGGLLFAWLVARHTHGVNGPEWWHWRWQERNDLPRVAVLLALAALPALAAQWLPRRALQLAALGVSLVALQWTTNAIHAPWHGARRIEALTRSWISNSYFSIAEPIVQAEQRGLEVDWLGEYGTLLRGAPLHAKTKPPGPIAFYTWTIRLFGNARAPLAAAVLISLLSVAAIVATWWMVRSLAGEEAALQAATLLALTPSMTLMFPSLDITYPIVTCLLLATWLAALAHGRAREAALFGLLLFFATMTSYSFLVLGAPLAIVTLVRRRHALRATSIAIVTCVAAYALFWLVTRFDPIAAFRTATAMQQQLLTQLHRPWPRTIPYDLLDFALGSAWVPVLLAALWLTRRERDAVAYAALATPLIVAVTGLLQSETARVWIFLLPLLMLPASLELSRWPRPARLAAHATMVVVTIVLYANLRFLDPV